VEEEGVLVLWLQLLHLLFGGGESNTPTHVLL
jgi:hypothetical protein